MKKLILFVVIAVFTLNANGQNKPQQEPIKTLLNKGEKKDIYLGGMGAAQLSATSINDNAHLLLGGYGGVLLNRKFLLGGYGMSLVTNEDFKGLKEGEEIDAKLNMGYGGLYFTYYHNMENLINFSFPLALCVGGASVRDNDISYESYDPEYSRKVESSTLFVIEPGMNINFNFSRFFILSAGLSYRFALLARTLVNVEQQDLSAFSFNLALNFGKF